MERHKSYKMIFNRITPAFVEKLHGKGFFQLSVVRDTEDIRINHSGTTTLDVRF